MKIFKNPLLLIEFSILIIVIILGVFWLLYPEGNYEPVIVIFLIVLSFLEFFRRAKEKNIPVGLTGWNKYKNDTWKVFVKNPTKESFYDCVVYIYSVEHSTRNEADLEIVFGTIPPKKTIRDSLKNSGFTSTSFGIPLVALEYTDSKGIHWRRNRNGQLASIRYRRPFD